MLREPRTSYKDIHAGRTFLQVSHAATIEYLTGNTHVRWSSPVITICEEELESSSQIGVTFVVKIAEQKKLRCVSRGLKKEVICNAFGTGYRIAIGGTEK